MSVTLRHLADQVELEVSDDGVGFDPAHLAGTLRSGRGFGLPTARERLHREGGDLAVDSAPGQGTRIRASIPWGAADLDVIAEAGSGEEAGARGCLLKAGPTGDLFRAVRSAAEGGLGLAAEVVGDLVGQVVSPAPELTLRERGRPVDGRRAQQPLHRGCSVPGGGDRQDHLVRTYCKLGSGTGRPRSPRRSAGPAGTHLRTTAGRGQASAAQGVRPVCASLHTAAICSAA
ncbi:sensor histidine kinase [Streptomyces sp. NPDC001351]|uniref:sensor histidine kinase n=1 Tax=Streptomyces sp. NPDC001351 TaxID=3364564 RepID=UPI0036A97017